MGKFININTKIPPLPIRLRPGFYGLTVIFYDTPKRNTQILKQRSWGSRYRIVTKTVGRCTHSGTRVRAGRGLGARAAGVTPLRVFIPGAHVPILFLALALSFGCLGGLNVLLLLLIQRNNTALKFAVCPRLIVLYVLVLCLYCAAVGAVQGVK